MFARSAAPPPASWTLSGAVATLALGLVVLLSIPGAASAGSTTWLSPVRLDADQDVSFEVAAANQAGAAVAVWQDYDEEGIRAAYRSPSGAWGPTEVPETAPTRFAHEAVAVDAQGVVTLVYSRCDTCGMLARRRATDGTWSAAAVLDDLGAQYAGADDPQVAAGPDGRVTAVWTARTPDDKEQSIRTSTFTAGSWSAVETLSPPLRGETELVYETRRARVAVDEDGRAVIATLSQTQDMSSYAVQDNPWSLTLAARPPGAGEFAPDVQVAERTETSRPGMPAVAMADGVATLAWEDETNAGDYYRTELRARRYDLRTSTLGAIADVVDGTVPEGHRHGGPVLAVTPAGDATVAWTFADESAFTAVPNEVRSRTWRAGGAWDDASTVGSGISEEAYDVAAGADGTVAVSWHRTAGNEAPADARLRRPDGTWTAAKALGGPDAQRSAFPFVAVEADGDALAVWRAMRVDGNTQTDFVEAMSTGEPPADAAGPQITISTPAIGQRFAKGADVTVDFTCTDDIGVTQCTGTVADGAKLPTGTVGEHSLTVVARDAAGHETTRTHGYFVDAPATDDGGGGGGTEDTGSTAGTGDRPGGEQTQAFVPQAPQAYHEAGPGAAPADVARQRLSAPVIEAARSVPGKLKGSALLDGKLGVSVRPTTPDVDVRAGLALVSRGGGLLSDNGLGLISGNGLDLIGTAAGNLIGPAAGNLIGPAAGNLIGPAAGNIAQVRARAAARPRLSLTPLAKGKRFFPAPKAGKVRLKPAKQGRAALRRAFRRPGRQTVKVLYVVALTERGSGRPTVFTARRVKLAE